MGILFYQMLFGKTPHRAGSLEELILKVNKKVIRFPQKLNNEKYQILLEKMLKYNAEERISWKEIFEDELFNPKPVVENNIKESMRIAETVSSNKLEMSTRMNEIYFQDKKVLQRIELTKGQQQEMNQKPGVVNEPQEKDVFKSIAKKYEQNEGRKNIIR